MPASQTPENTRNGTGPDRELHALQGAVEGAVVQAETITMLGQSFRVAEKVGLMPLLKFAHSAASGIGSEDIEGMAAMYAMIRDCIHPGHPCTCDAPDPQPGGDKRHRPGCEFDPGDWPAFERHAIDARADENDLFGVVSEVIEMITARPTRAPSASQRSAPPKSARSRARSLPPGSDGLLSVEDLSPLPGLSPRVFCNIVYARRVALLDSDGRDKFDRDLYAPAEGWDAAERRVLLTLGVAAARGDTDPEEG